MGIKATDKQQLAPLLRSNGDNSTAEDVEAGDFFGGTTELSLVDAQELLKTGMLNGAVLNTGEKVVLQRLLVPLGNAVTDYQVVNEPGAPPRFADIPTDDINTDYLEIEYVALKQKIRIPGSLVVFTDKYTPSWRKEEVYGRMDPIATFQGTGRGFQLTWQLDLTQASAPKMLKVLSDVAKFMYPVYDAPHSTTKGASSMVAPPVLRFTIRAGKKEVGSGIPADLKLITNTAPGSAGGLLGLVDSFQYGSFVAGKGGGGEINMTRAVKDEELMMVPTHIDITFSVTVLHEKGKVGWVWSDSGQSVSFGQGNAFPYGYGTMLKLDGYSRRPTDDAAAGPTADNRTMTDAELDRWEDAQEAIESRDPTTP